MLEGIVENPLQGNEREYTVLLKTVWFLEKVTEHIHGLLDDYSIFHTILNEFKKSDEYGCCIHQISRNSSNLEFIGSSFLNGEEDGEGKNATSGEKVFTINYTKSQQYRMAVENGVGTYSTTTAIINELFSEDRGDSAFLAKKMLGNEVLDALIIPFSRYGFICGVITLTYNKLPADSVLLAKIFGTRISTALEMADQARQSKNVEEALKQSKGQLSNALQIARLGPWEYDVKKDLFTFTDEFYNIFRTTAEQHGGYMMSSADYAKKFLYPDDAQMVGEEVRMAIETTDPKYTSQLEHRIFYADGKVGIINVRIFIVKDLQGHTVKTYGVNQDITGQRKAEEELQQYRHQLEELVKERTDELKRELAHRQQAEQELHRAQKLESLGLLAGGIAHDFNNLLCGLFGFVDLARKSLDDPDTVKECLDEAMNCSSRARDLTEQLLTFAKGGTPVKKPVDLGVILRKTAKLSLSGSNVKSDFVLPEDLWMIEGDEGQLCQVFSNILLNARQAMECGGKISIVACNVELHINEIAGLPKGSFIRIIITDQGIGMPKEVLLQAFDPFFTTKKAGTGLGLAISYSIIKKHGGRIAINSECGVGTVVTIHLPASLNGVPVENVKQSIDLTGSGRILFMDDEEIICRSVVKMLEKTGYEIICANDGEQAIELYRKSLENGKPFSVAILDLTVIGGMGGEKAIRKLQELDPKVKGIVSSGYADSPVLSNPGAYGFAGDIAKPYVVDELLRTLKDVLR
jgi:signal transduction histidine kinase/ActR/RegA family two-component response regulator